MSAHSRKVTLMRACSTFLMFQGDAEKALTLYSEAFPAASVDHVEHYGADDLAPEGQLKMAYITLAGQRFRLFDSPSRHDFTFTPAISIFVEFDSREELEAAHAVLSAGGASLMPIGEYPFSELFAWVADRFGVSWQLSLV